MSESTAPTATPSPAPALKVTRRAILAGTAAVAAGGAAIAAGNYWLGTRKSAGRFAGKKVIVVGIDGMDPRLCARMMDEGLLPHLAKLRSGGGFSTLGTSTPPQSPVAWASFINGAGPGDHGIFDFIHRHPEDQCAAPFYAAAETLPGEGHWDVGGYRLQLDFWPFNHKPPTAVLRRHGVPFWDYLDAAGVPTTFYDLPSNYPASPSHYGHHRCLCGMGTPDMLGGFGTYQHFAEDNPAEPVNESGGKRFRLQFEDDTARAHIVGPDEPLLRSTRPIQVELTVHRDREANAAVIELQGQKLVLKAGQWSRWTPIDLPFDTPRFLPAQSVGGLCRFYLQQVAPTFRLYVSPINMSPAAPAKPISEPSTFAQDLASRLGPFATTGFQEDYSARKNNVFADDEYARQAGMVLEERLALLEYAIDNYEDGLLFFYFSSSDLQSHMFWWDSDEKHPIRSGGEARKYFEHVHQLYRKLDDVIGELMDRYAGKASLIVMSDHGFANFGRQFNLNTWLRGWGYLGPPDCTSLMTDVDWSQTSAYGLGINGLYLNLKGRERDGIVEPGDQREALLAELIERLEGVTDTNGQPVIRGVHRSDKIYQGDATALAPDLIIGYRRGYRASWETIMGGIGSEVLLDNDNAWSADHCADALEVPGVLFSSRPIRRASPSLVDLAPSILAEFGLPVPSRMVGKDIFSA